MKKFLTKNQMEDLQVRHVDVSKASHHFNAISESIIHHSFGFNVDEESGDYYVFDIGDMMDLLPLYEERNGSKEGLKIVYDQDKMLWVAKYGRDFQVGSKELIDALYWTYISIDSDIYDKVVSADARQKRQEERMGLGNSNR